TVRVRESVAHSLQERLGGRRVTAIDLVVREGRSAVRGGCLPSHGDLGIAAGGREVLWSRRGCGWRGQPPTGQRMEFPVVRAFPEDKTLEIEGDAPVGLVLTQGRVIAVRDPDTAIAFPQPVPIDFDSQVATRGADCDDLSGIRAERLVVGIPATAVLLRVPSRAICGIDAVAVQG